MTIQLSTPTLPRPASVPLTHMISETLGLTGLRAQAKIATPSGWRSVGDLAVGDQVETLNGTKDTITKINRFAMQRDDHIARPSTWNMFFPAGAIGNQRDVVVASRQMLLLQSEAFALACGAPRALLQAFDFFGHFGAFRVIPDSGLSLTVLACSKPVVLIGKEGLMYQCGGIEDDPMPSAHKTRTLHYPKLVGRDGAKIVEAKTTRFRPFDLFQCLDHNYTLMDDAEARP